MLTVMFSFSSGANLVLVWVRLVAVADMENADLNCTFSIDILHSYFLLLDVLAPNQQGSLASVVAKLVNQLVLFACLTTLLACSLLDTISRVSLLNLLLILSTTVSKTVAREFSGQNAGRHFARGRKQRRQQTSVRVGSGAG